MLSLTINAAKSGFFNPGTIADAADKASKGNLSRLGAFVRKTAIGSIRTSARVSRPGRPPSSHTGTYRKLIYFAFDAPRKSVVIGPALLRAGSRVPALLEYGGTVARGRTAGGRPGVAVYRPRPHMGPAFQAEIKKAPDLWANSIK
jgi:hypothetical protein